MILQTLTLVECAAFVAAEDHAFMNLKCINLKMKAVMILVMMVRIVVMKWKSTANVYAMLMIVHAGLVALNALNLSSVANLKLTKRKSQKKNHPHQ